MPKELIIKLSKKRTFIIFLGSLIFTIISILFILNPEKYKSFMFFKKEIILYIGAVGLVFFGIASIYIGYRLFTNKIGVIVNDKGIYDNTSMSSVGWIKWNDITAIEVYEIPIRLLLKNSISIVLIKVKEPNKYIMESSIFKRNLLNLNYKNYGTPITINTNGLAYSAIELQNLLANKHNKMSKL